MDYSYDYSPATTAAVAGGTAIYVIICLAISVFAIVCMWKIFAKAGKPGWASIVPFYNLYILFEITWGNGILFLLNLIPIVNAIIMLITYVKLAKAFGKSGGFAAGLIFLNLIFVCILGFGSAQYIGPNGVAAAPAE
jgi:hypothetical protein